MKQRKGSIDLGVIFSSNVLRGNLPSRFRQLRLAIFIFANLWIADPFTRCFRSVKKSFSVENLKEINLITTIPTLNAFLHNFHSLIELSMVPVNHQTKAIQ